jgi:hypothetical protein
MVPNPTPEVCAHVGADENRPVLTGLLALVAVAVAVGLVTAVTLVAAAHVVGLGGGHAANVAGDAGASMYVPKPQKTQPASGPSITLGSSPTSSSSPTQTPKLKVRQPKKRISLQTGQTTVAPMGRIDLTGTYPGGEGAVLNVQKFSNGSWQDFYSVSATVTNGTFSTYVQTGIPGMNRFRVVDSDTHLASNTVRVRVR